MLLLDLFESTLTGDLMRAIHPIIKKTIDNFIKENKTEILAACNNSDAIERKMQDIDKEISDIQNREHNWKEEDRLVTSLQEKNMDLHGEIEHNFYESKPNQEIINRFIHTIEVQFQRVARDHVESVLGKIEKFNPENKKLNSDEFAKEMDERHLYWLDHIMVQIDTEGVNKITGKPKTSGGYYQKSPIKGILKNQSSQSLHWGNDFAVHINIYSSNEIIWKAITERYLERSTTERYGESSIEHPIENLINPLCSTFVHEMVHLIQDAKARLKDYRHKMTSYTRLPEPDAKRQKVKTWSEDNSTSTRRAGKRGDHGFDPDRFAKDVDHSLAYLGNVIEIEAHASHVAAEMYMDFIKDSYRYYSDDENQRRINDFVRHSIENVNYNDMPDNWYVSLIARLVRDIRKKPSPTTRERKLVEVWNLFKKKLVAHLQSYAKPVPEEIR